MHIDDAVFLEDLCPKFRFRQWRKSIHKFTGKSCIYCGKPSESIDHVLPQSQGDLRLAIRLLQWANPNFKVKNKKSFEEDRSNYKAA